jgi:hypothetical protein
MGEPTSPLVFEHETRGQRVLFGAGRAAGHLADETARFGARTPLVIASVRHDDLIKRAGLAAATRYRRIVPHVPVHVAEEARGWRRIAVRI